MESIKRTGRKMDAAWKAAISRGKKLSNKYPKTGLILGGTAAGAGIGAAAGGVMGLLKKTPRRLGTAVKSGSKIGTLVGGALAVRSVVLTNASKRR